MQAGLAQTSAACLRPEGIHHAFPAARQRCGQPAAVAGTLGQPPGLQRSQDWPRLHLNGLPKRLGQHRLAAALQLGLCSGQACSERAAGWDAGLSGRAHGPPGPQTALSMPCRQQALSPESGAPARARQPYPSSASRARCRCRSCSSVYSTALLDAYTSWYILWCSPRSTMFFWLVMVLYSW